MPHLLGDISYTWPFFATAVLGYFLGSVPFGVIITRLAGLDDIREIGSGNIGATNVLRTGRKGLALLTLLLDISKGAAATAIGKAFGPDIMVMAAVGVFFGHLFPLWLGFRGGKGVATYGGIMFGINPIVGLACCGTWLVVAFLFRISSLAALTSALVSPLFAYLLIGPQITELSAFLVILIFIRHHANIMRLIRGTEPRIGAK